MNQHSVDREFPEQSFNARLLLKEMHKRGITLKSLGSNYMAKATFKDHDELLYDMYTSLIPYPLGVMVDDKYYTKKLLQKYGYSVTPGQTFHYNQKEQAVVFADEVGYPIVIKPTIGTHGDHVYLDIDSRQELEDKIDFFVSQHIGNGYYLIEKQAQGNEYRLFVTRDKFFAAVHRDPANVIGDGVSSLSELVEKENHRRMNPRNTCLCEIRLDKVAKDYLAKNNLSLDDVPAQGKKVYLRSNSNVATGGNCYEITEQVHPSIVTLAQAVLVSVDMPFVGIDLICDHVDEELGDYIICELNSAPGLSMHMMPELGKPQDGAAAMVDMLFPETKQ